MIYKNNLIWRCMCLVLVSVFSMGSYSVSAHESRHNFTNRTIQGNWGFSATANIVAPVPGRCPGLGANAVSPPCSLVAVGIFSFNKKGKCSLNVRMGVDGLTLPPHGQGVVSTDAPGGVCDFEVRPDGTGSIHEHFPDQPLVTLDFVITDHKREIRFIRRDVVMASGVMKRQ